MRALTRSRCGCQAITAARLRHIACLAVRAPSELLRLNHIHAHAEIFVCDILLFCLRVLCVCGNEWQILCSVLSPRAHALFCLIFLSRSSHTSFHCFCWMLFSFFQFLASLWNLKILKWVHVASSMHVIEMCSTAKDTSKRWAYVWNYVAELKWTAFENDHASYYALLRWLFNESRHQREVESITQKNFWSITTHTHTHDRVKKIQIFEFDSGVFECLCECLIEANEIWFN